MTVETKAELPKPGDKLDDRYELVRLVADHGFFSVYEAIDAKAGEPVAVKIFSPTSGEQAPTSNDKFVAEAKQVQALLHDNTIRIRNVSHLEDGRPFFVMELLVGERLLDLVGRLDKLETEAAVEVSSQALLSLAEAHKRGVLHRDLSPQNIWICRRDDDAPYFVKVLGFGIGKAQRKGLWQKPKDSMNFLGVPAYTPPEILRGMLSSAASDVYSIGLILAEMLTGLPVVEGGSEQEIVRKQASMMPLALPKELEGHRLEAILKKATNKRVQARYTDASEMLMALVGEPVGTRLLKTVAEISAPTAEDHIPTAIYPSIEFDDDESVDPEEPAELSDDDPQAVTDQQPDEAPSRESKTTPTSTAALETGRATGVLARQEAVTPQALTAVGWDLDSVMPPDSVAKPEASKPSPPERSKPSPPKRQSAPPPIPRATTKTPSTSPKPTSPRDMDGPTLGGGKTLPTLQSEGWTPPGLPVVPSGALSFETLDDEPSQFMTAEAEPVSPRLPALARVDRDTFISAVDEVVTAPFTPAFKKSEDDETAPEEAAGIESPPEVTPEAESAEEPEKDHTSPPVDVESGVVETSSSDAESAFEESGNIDWLDTDFDPDHDSGAVPELEPEVDDEPLVALPADLESSTHDAVFLERTKKHRRLAVAIVLLFVVIAALASVLLFASDSSHEPITTTEPTQETANEQSGQIQSPNHPIQPDEESAADTTSHLPEMTAEERPDAPIQVTDDATTPTPVQAEPPAQGVVDEQAAVVAPPDTLTEEQALLADPTPTVPGDTGELVAIAAPRTDVDGAPLQFELDVAIVEGSQEAVDFLENALIEGTVDNTERAEASVRLLTVYHELIHDLAERDFCSAAEGRLAAAITRAALLPPNALQTLEAQRSEIDDCRERLELEPWDAVRYAELIDQGTEEYEEARGLPPEEEARRLELLEASVENHFRAERLLRAALIDESVSRDRRADAVSSMEWVNRRIAHIQCAMSRCAAAEFFLDESTGTPDVLEEDESLNLEPVREEIEECRTRTTASYGTFSWTIFNDLVEHGSLDRDVSADLAELEAPPPLIYRVYVRIYSRPSRARVYLDDERIGRTPFLTTLESAEPSMTLLLSKRDHRAQSVTIDMTSGEAEFTIELERRHPFGQIDSLGDR